MTFYMKIKYSEKFDIVRETLKMKIPIKDVSKRITAKNNKVKNLYNFRLIKNPYVSNNYIVFKVSLNILNGKL